MRYIVLVLVLIILVLPPASVLGDGMRDGTSVSINLPYSAPRVNASTGNPAMVAGVYHNLSVGIGHPFSRVNVSFSRDLVTISFLYDSGNWSVSGNESSPLLDKSHSHADADSIMFVLGLPLSSETGDWNLSVAVDGDLSYRGYVSVELPYPHFSMAAPDFVFRVDPFTNEVLYPTVDTYRVRLVNPGNVPLEIHPEFESFENMFSITNATGTFTPLEQRYLYLSFTVPAWSPRIIKTHVSVVGTPMFVIPTAPGTANINSSFKQTFNVEIDVVRRGYELIDLGDVTVQYKKTLYADYNAEIYLDLFFTGVKNITLDVETESIRLDGVTLENRSVSSPVFIELTNTSEKHMRLTLNTSSPQITATVDYHLQAFDLSVSRDFRTEVVVGPRPVKPYDSEFFVNVLGLVLFLVFLAVLFGYVSVIYRRNRQTAAKRKEEEREKAIRRARKSAERKVRVKRYNGRPSHGRTRRGKSGGGSRKKT